MLIVTSRTFARFFQSRTPDFYFKLVDLQRHYIVGHTVDTLSNKNRSFREIEVVFL